MDEYARAVGENECNTVDRHTIIMNILRALIHLNDS